MYAIGIDRRIILSLSLCVATLQFLTSAFRYELCNNVHHETRNDHTCCSAKGKKFVIKSSLRLSSHWKECAIEAEDDSEDAVTSAWRVYNCTLEKELCSKTLNMRNFFEIMAKYYPYSVKSEMVKKMKNINVMDFGKEAVHKYQQTNAFRDAYYSMEYEICDEHHKTITMVEGTCDFKMEIYHRNGACCQNVSLPFQFMYNPFRYGEDEVVDNCVKNLMESIGTPVNMDVFSRARYMCYPTCEYISNEVMTEEELWEDPDVESITTRMIPKYFAKSLKNRIMEYVAADESLLDLNSLRNEFSSSVSQEFSNLDEDKARTLFLSCKTHRLIETLINRFLTKECEDMYASEDFNLDFWEEFGSLIVLF